MLEEGVRKDVVPLLTPSVIFLNLLSETEAKHQSDGAATARSSASSPGHHK